MAIAMNWGILTLLGVIVSVLAAFASFFVYLNRRANLAEMPGPVETSTFAAHDPQEGIAQC